MSTVGCVLSTDRKLPDDVLLTEAILAEAGHLECPIPDNFLSEAPGAYSHDLVSAAASVAPPPQDSSGERTADFPGALIEATSPRGGDCRAWC